MTKPDKPPFRKRRVALLGCNRSSVGGLPRALCKFALATGLSISTEHADVLITLMEQADQKLSSVELAYLLDPHRPIRMGTVYERISFLRSLLGHAAILEFVPNTERLTAGRMAATTYQLSEMGRGVCFEALAKAGAALIATGVPSERG